MDDNEKKKLAGELAKKMQAMLDAASTGEDEKLQEAMTDAMKTAKGTVDKIAGTTIETDATTDTEATTDSSITGDNKTTTDTTSTVEDSDGEQEDLHEMEDLPTIVSSKAHSLLDSIKKGWADYTSDVREDEEDNNDETIIDTDNTSTDDKTSTLATAASPTASISPVKAISRISQIGGSFLNGVLGRPQSVYNGKTNSKTSTPKTVLRALTGVFAVLGLIAVVRATMDAFKPRR